MLEVNRSHKKAYLRHLISSPVRTRISALGISLMMALGSGALPVSAMTPEKNNPLSAMFESDTNVSLDTIVAIPPEYQSAVEPRLAHEKDEYTVGDLLSLTSLSLPIYNDSSSLDWLNYCTNLEYLTLMVHAEDTELFQDIKNLPKLKSLDLYALANQSIDEEDFSFLKNSNLDSISLNGFDVERGILEDLTPNIKSINIFNSDNQDIIQTDFTKFKALEKLDFKTMKPYDIAIKFSSKDYQMLINRGTNVTASDEEVIDQVIQINQKLDEIVEGLSILEDDTDQEKLDKILIYVLENLEYDEEVSKATENFAKQKELASAFYEGGYLYAALNKDTAICGNYAALVSALAYRVNLNSELISSNTHAWNLVEVENQLYYVDATWLDDKYLYDESKHCEYDEDGNIISVNISYTPIKAVEALKDGKGNQLNWYLEDPLNFPNTSEDFSHDAINMPDFIEIEPVADEVESEDTTSSAKKETMDTDADLSTKKNATKDISNDKYKINIGGKELVVAGGAIIGVLTALGGAIAVTKKRKQERKNFRRRSTHNIYNDRSYYTSSRKIERKRHR